MDREKMKEEMDKKAWRERRRETGEREGASCPLRPKRGFLGTPFSQPTTYGQKATDGKGKGLMPLWLCPLVI